MYETIVIICAFGVATVGHTYPYKMHTVCEYFCERSQSKYHYYYNPVTVIPYGHSCPPSKRVTFEKWVKKKR